MVITLELCIMYNDAILDGGEKESDSSVELTDTGTVSQFHILFGANMRS